MKIDAVDHDRDCVISSHKLAFSSFDGVVEDVQHWTETQVWSEGGGFVPPWYGGYPSHKHGNHAQPSVPTRTTDKPIQRKVLYQERERVIRRRSRIGEAAARLVRSTSTTP